MIKTARFLVAEWMTAAHAYTPSGGEEAKRQTPSLTLGYSWGRLAQVTGHESGLSEDPLCEYKGELSSFSF